MSIHSNRQEAMHYDWAQPGSGSAVEMLTWFCILCQSFVSLELDLGVKLVALRTQAPRWLGAFGVEAPTRPFTGEPVAAKSPYPSISSFSLGSTTAGSAVRIFVAPPAMHTGIYAALWASTKNCRNSSLLSTEVGIVLSHPSKSELMNERWYLLSTYRCNVQWTKETMTETNSRL